MLSDSEFLEIFNKKISELIVDQNILELYQELAEELRNNGYLDNYDPEDVVNRILKITKFFSMEDVCKFDSFDFYTRILVENESGFIAYIGE